MNNANAIYQLGSKSKLQLTNPCKPNIINPSEKEQAVIHLLFGKIFSQRDPSTYTRDDFESDKDWQHFQSIHISWFRFGGGGVRGSIVKNPPIYFASINPKMNYTLFPPPDPEREELIPDYSTISNGANAFYIHCENGEVQDLTVVKGSLKIEDDMGIRSMEVPESTILNQWYDGTQMTEITILTK